MAPSTDTDAPTADAQRTCAPHLARVHIQGFQSLHSVDLELGPLTVIVGPSSSGKSALVRALAALHHNVRGTSFITHGFQTAKIAATLGDGTTVMLSRSTTASSKHNAYALQHSAGLHAPEGFQGDPPPIVFTKLNGEVPEEVRALLPAIPDLTFASQFDKPYLLDATPGDVARTLASLTNVHVILSAAREANRQRLATAATLKTRQGDLSDIEARTEEFRALAARRKAQDTARTLTEQATALAAQIDTLATGVARIRQAEESATHHARVLLTLPDTAATAHTLAAAHTRRAQIQNLAALTTQVRTAETTLQATTAILSRPLPTVGPLSTLAARRDTLRSILLRYRDATQARERAAAAQTLATGDLLGAQSDYITALSTQGTCPTCGQSTTDLSTTDLSTHDLSTTSLPHGIPGVTAPPA